MKTVVLWGEPKSKQHIYGLVCSGRFPPHYMTDQGRALKSRRAVPVGSAGANMATKVRACTRSFWFPLVYYPSQIILMVA